MIFIIKYIHFLHLTLQKLTFFGKLVQIENTLQ